MPKKKHQTVTEMRRVALSAKTRAKAFVRLLEYIREAAQRRDWDTVAELAILPERIREFLDGLRPEERAVVVGGDTVEQFLSDLLEQIEQARAFKQWEAVAQLEEMRDAVLASSKLRKQ